MKRFPMFLSAAVLLTATSAFAQQTGGVKINGTVDNFVTADDNVNTAVGNDSVALQSIGTLHSGTEVNGTLTNDVAAFKNENIAVGNDSEACQSVGSIGEFDDC